MWVCAKGHKNSNSNKSCHGPNCDEPKPKSIQVLEKQKAARQEVRDRCPKCNRHTLFVRVKGNKWSCTVCHSKCKMVGKPMPEPQQPEIVLVGSNTTNQN